jgi:ABC-type transport system involved in multi-copper enzyme maturation permease subunit
MNPIFKRELTQFLKSGKIIATMIGLVVLLGVFLYFLWPRTAVFSMASTESKQVFTIFLICNLAFVLILVPAFCATSITGEKENNSFIMLYTTLLKPHNILTGKLFSSLTMISILIISTLPVSALCSLSGGINLPILMKAYVVIFVASLTFGIMSLAVSAMCEKSSSSLVLSYLLIAMVSGGTWLPYALFGGDADWMDTLMMVRSLSPFDTLYSVLYPELYNVSLEGESLFSSMGTYLVTNFVIALVSTSIFIYGFLYKSTQKSAKTVEKFDHKTKSKFVRRIMYLWFFDPLRRKKPISNFMNPVFITELRSKVMGNPRFTIWAISISSMLSIVLMILTSTNIGPAASGGYSAVQKAAIIYQIGLVALLAPVVCSSSVTTEINSGTLVLVRMSRIGAVRFVLGKLYASFFYVFIILACTIPIIFSLIQISIDGSKMNIVISLAIVVMTTICLVTAGLCTSSFCRKTDSATAISYAFSGILCLGTMAVLLFAENLSPTTVGAWLTLNPITAALGKANGEFPDLLSPDAWIYNLIFLSCLSLFFVMLASGRVYKLMRERT